ncbi:thiamine pyrophosphate-binding protein [Variovorax sp.]|jgi:sulfopyruvate decarboxylase subunit alpha|uniref:thiamine pyrophosphate-binding protein n=1 Tax=Variovorax sp. TaxID=1871043 RepID=UPI003BA8B6EC
MQVSVSHPIPASAAVAALRRCAVRHVVTVPDWVQLSLHSHLESDAADIDLANCCSENQCLTLAAGLYLAGSRALVVMQNQGFYNCINTLRALALDARIPLVIMVGQFGREFANLDQPSTQSRRTMVRLLEPMLHTLGVPFQRLDGEDDLGRIDAAFEQAEAEGGPAVLIVGAPMAWH